MSVAARPDTQLPLRAVHERELVQSIDGRATQNLGFAWSVDDPDPGRLRQALERVVERHELLRSRFRVGTGAAFQEVLPTPSAPVDWAVEDWSATDLDRAATEVLAQPFDLFTPPLYRLRLGWLSPSRAILMLSVAHVIWDAHSALVFAGDLISAYADPAAALPGLELQVADLAAFERPLGAGAGPGRPGVRERLRLPRVGHERLADYDPGEVSFAAADATVARALRHRASVLSTTLPILLCGAFAALVAGTTGEARVPVCVANADRREQDLPDAIGYLIDVEVISVSADPARRFDELVAAAHTATVEAFARGEGGERQAGGRERFLREPVPLADAFFNFVPAIPSAPQDPVSLLRPIALRRITWNFPSRSRPWGCQLDLEIWTRDDDRLDAALSSDRRVLPDAEAEAFTSGYRRALELIAREPALTVGQLRQLAPASATPV